MSIAPQSMVTIYSDVMAVLLLVGLVVISREGDKKDPATGIFGSMCLGVVLIAFGNAVRAAMEGQSYAWAVPVALAAQTVAELALLFTVYQWMLYVDYKLYGSRDHLKRKYRGFFIPIGILALMLIVNCATGFIFSMTDEAVLKPTFVYYILIALEFLYLIFSIVSMAVYLARGGKRRFFSITPVLVPVILGTVVDLTTNYSAGALGLAVGLVFMYFSLAHAWRFDDKKSGFFNKNFLSYLEEKGNDYLGVVAFKAAGRTDKLEEIIKGELPQDSVIIHYDEKRYLFFTETDREEEIRFLADLVQHAVNKHDEKFTDDEAIKLTYNYYVRSSEEDIRQLFFKAVN